MNSLFEISVERIDQEQFSQLPVFLQLKSLISFPWSAARFVKSIIENEKIRTSRQVQELFSYSTHEDMDISFYVQWDYYYANISEYTSKRSILTESEFSDLQNVIIRRKLSGIELEAYIYSPIVIDFSGTRIESIPMLDYSNCKIFKFEHSALREINSEHIAQMKDIEILNVSSNKLKYDAVIELLKALEWHELYVLDISDNMALRDVSPTTLYKDLDTIVTEIDIKSEDFYLNISKMGLEDCTSILRMLMRITNFSFLHLSLEGYILSSINDELIALDAQEVEVLNCVPDMYLNLSMNQLRNSYKIPLEADFLCKCWNFEGLKSLEITNADIGSGWQRIQLEAFYNFLQSQNELEWLDLSNNDYCEKITGYLAELLEEDLVNLRVLLLDQLVNPNTILEALAARNEVLMEKNLIEVLSIAHCEHKIRGALMLGILFYLPDVPFNSCVLLEEFEFDNNLRVLNISGSFRPGLFSTLTPLIEQLHVVACTCSDSHMHECNCIPKCDLQKLMLYPQLAFINTFIKESHNGLRVIDVSNCTLGRDLDEFLVVISSLRLQVLIMQSCELNDVRCQEIVSRLLSSLDILDLGNNKAGYLTLKTTSLILGQKEKFIVNLKSPVRLKPEEEAEIVFLLQKVRFRHSSLLCANLKNYQFDFILKTNFDLSKYRERLVGNFMVSLMNEMGRKVMNSTFNDEDLIAYYCDDND